ncbi:peroxisomal ATPase PEX6 [Epargyreus clarus]|uniref:peroxisomal ATPase PEX6 n=1 Tax=Epargyreus clarus TaxID=520877 RepID=UPI003C2C7FE9
MREENNLQLKLWLVKFCLKIVYPKFNYYAFLVFLAIKYRYNYNKGLLYRRNMKLFEIKTVPKDILRHLAKDLSEDNLTVLLDKCIIVPKKYVIEMTVDNLFYVDNGVLWVVLKLAASTKRKLEERDRNENKDSLKYNLTFVTEELHRRLWHSEATKSYESARIVPIVGSSLVEDDTCVTTENEFQNIVSSFGLNMYESVQVSFHPVPSFDYSPKIASLAEVNLIVNDYDLSNDFLKEVLSNHFELPKLVSTNDIISIDLDPKITAKYHYKYLDLVESVGKLFFKCRKLSSDSVIGKQDKIIQAFYIVKGVTQLSLGENVHEIKPKNEYFKLPDSDEHLRIIQLCPTGLREKFNEIQETISPFLTGEMNALSSSMSSPIIPMLLLTGSLGSGRHLLVKTIAKYNGLNCLQADCNALQSSTAKQTESKINSTIQKAKAASPAIVLLDNFEVFAVDPENNEDYRVMEYFLNSITDLYLNYTKHPIIFIAITERVDLKPNIMRMFLEKFHIPKLSVQQRYEMLLWFASVMQLNVDDDLIVNKDKISLDSDSNVPLLSEYSKEIMHRVASKTETYAYGDLDTLVHFAMRESYLKQHNSYFQLPRDPKLQEVREDDFNAALESIRSLQSQHLDAPKIPKVHWDDIGGLDKLKKELLKTIEFPIKFPHLFKSSNLKRSGILLYGPPGCGKTLVAKAVSTELNVSFLSVKGPELLNMYIGQSEENVRKVFESARACSPCIVFLDELDALAPRRGAAGDSGGASDRVVSQLLAELDGVASGEDAESSSFVFIMGATNRPDLLEQSLLRPGRLDKLIYVGPYDGRAEKTCVLKALCRSYKLRPCVNLEDIALALPERCTGADLLHVVSTARAAAVRGLVAKLHSGALMESELSPDSVILGVSELLQGVETFRPSVTEEELSYYESLQTLM